MKSQRRHAVVRRRLSLLAILLANPRFLPASDSSISLYATLSPAVYGAPVTLTATVSPVTATGKVAFYDGISVLGIAAISSGSGTLTTALLSAGAHSLTARYDGASANQISVSPAVMEIVNGVSLNGFVSASGSPFLNRPGQFTRAPAIADFTGDGNLDLAVLGGASFVNGVAVNTDTLTILFGDGQGGFTAGTPIPIGSTGYAGSIGPSGPTVGDFNGDGNMDLVFPVSLADPFSGDWAIELWLGDGKGGFTEAPGSPFFQGSIGFTGVFSAVAAADFNGDGTLDLAFTKPDGLHVWLGDGNAGFPTQLGPFSMKTTIYPWQAAVLDFNGDGYADLVLIDPIRFELFVGDGTGTLKSADGQYPEVFGGYDIAVADFNGDGKSDIAITTLSDVEIILGNTAASLSNTTIPVGRPVWNLVSGDLNGDGKPDLVLLSQDFQANEPWASR